MEQLSVGTKYSRTRQWNHLHGWKCFVFFCWFTRDIIRMFDRLKRNSKKWNEQQKKKQNQRNERRNDSKGTVRCNQGLHNRTRCSQCGSTPIFSQRISSQWIVSRPRAIPRGCSHFVHRARWRIRAESFIRSSRKVLTQRALSCRLLLQLEVILIHS